MEGTTFVNTYLSQKTTFVLINNLVAFWNTISKVVTLKQENKNWKFKCYNITNYYLALKTLMYAKTFHGDDVAPQKSV